MKKLKFLVLFFPLLASACKTTQSYSVNPREFECYNLSVSLKKDAGWQQQCLTDDALYLTASREHLAKLPKKELCISNDVSINRDLADQMIKDKKINCDPHKKEAAKNYAEELSPGQLCYSWRSGMDDSFKNEAIKRKVKSRNLDCPSVLASIAAEHSANAQQMQATIMEQQRQDEITRDAMQSIREAFPKPVTTNCNTGIGGSVRCTSY